MYHQTRDGRFEDITAQAELSGAGHGMGVAAGDSDNDGKEDLFVTAYGSNHFYHNDGNCRFTLKPEVKNRCDDVYDID